MPGEFRILCACLMSSDRLASTRLGKPDNAENNIEAGYAVACPTGDNLFARRFVLADSGITEEFAFSNGRFGVQSTDLEVDVTVNIWDVSAGFPVGYPGTSNLLGSQVVNVPAGTSNAVISYNFSTPVVVPAGVTTIIVEVSKDGDAAFFLGGTATLADESYIASATCGLADYVTAASINFPDANYYITAKGSFTSSVVVPYEVDLDADGFATILAADLIQGIGVCTRRARLWAGPCRPHDLPGDGPRPERHGRLQRVHGGAGARRGGRQQQPASEAENL